jgi:ubiquinone/menaquinone biosynthesis C-methylase UbiE
MRNVDPKTVAGFGDEWTRFDHSTHDEAELRVVFDQYFEIFPWRLLPEGAVGFDLGCGTGRWARFVAPRVGKLHCVDASEAALAVAEKNLRDLGNCEFHAASVDAMPLPDASMDFGYSLGVLHHVPDTRAGIQSCVAKLKPGAPFLVYLYYAFDNRPAWFRVLWRASDPIRRVVASTPHAIRHWICSGIALLVYLPLARLARVCERLGFDVSAMPLSAYRERSFYVMRTDALDRFGTRLEQRFTADQIREMLQAAGLERIEFSRSVFWCAVGLKKR